MTIRRGRWLTILSGLITCLLLASIAMGATKTRTHYVKLGQGWTIVGRVSLSHGAAASCAVNVIRAPWDFLGVYRGVQVYVKAEDSSGHTIVKSINYQAAAVRIASEGPEEAYYFMAKTDSSAPLGCDAKVTIQFEADEFR